MTLKQLRDAFREDFDDLAAPYLFSDAWINRKINQALQEACRRARLIVDSETINDGATPTPIPICVHAVTATQRYLDLDKRIILVKRAKLSNMDHKLQKVYTADLDICYPDWETDTTRDPVAYATDYHTLRLHFIGPIKTDATLRLTVVREPLVAMSADNDVPEIAARYHEALLDWVKAQAYLKQDVEETFKPERAKGHMDLFEAEFGKRSSAIDETWIERHQMYDGHDGTF